MDRSENMRRIRSKDTSPELALRRALHRLGFRYRLHPVNLPGRPDLFFPRHRIAVFVHGCFWHQHKGCRYATRPKTRRHYWDPKFDRNAQRDIEHENNLRAQGYDVVIIWECAVERNIDAAVQDLVDLLTRPPRAN
jgi:DNA mismatch endonuclease, patch repair protein